jgi:hypothetical protein
MLSIAKLELLQQWPNQFRVTPLMIETLVDSVQFKGTCYRAANYIHTGEISGRGRKDRFNKRHGAAIKSFSSPYRKRCNQILASCLAKKFR